MRAPTQLGFRPHRGTDQAVWLLNHAIVTSCSPPQQGGHGGNLFACFVDLKQAFDSVSREELWHWLGHLGVTDDEFMHAVKSLYSHTEFHVKVDNTTSNRPFVTTRGVKQGCPLSPLLFGLLMDRLYHRINRDCPELGVRLRDSIGTIISHIMYDDDVVLLV